MYRTGDIVRGSYRIESTISHGDAAATYRAVTLTGDEPVVLRCLHLPEVTEWSAVGAFERAARRMKRLVHPSIPEFIEYFEDETGPVPSYCIVRRFVPGKTLAELPRPAVSQETDPKANGRLVFEQGLEALSYLHTIAPPVPHGAVLPEHLLLGQDGRLYLLGLGAGATDDGFTLDETPRSLMRQDIRDLGVSVLAYLYGAAFEELRSVDPYATGLVPAPDDRFERVLHLAVRQADREADLSAGELARLLAGRGVGPKPSDAAGSRTFGRSGTGRAVESDISGTGELPVDIGENGGLIRRYGKLTLLTETERDVITVENPLKDRPENQLFRIALEAWIKWPIAVIIALSALSGGSLFVPLLVLNYIPAVRAWVRRLHARFRDERVLIDRHAVTVSDQLPPQILSSIDEVRLKKKPDEAGRITLEITVYTRSGQEQAFSLYHLEPEEAEAAAAFLLERIEYRKRG